MCLPATINLIDVDQQITNQDQSALNTITPRDILQSQQNNPVIAQRYDPNYKVQNRQRQKLQMQALAFES